MSSIPVAEVGGDMPPAHVYPEQASGWQASASIDSGVVTTSRQIQFALYELRKCRLTAAKQYLERSCSLNIICGRMSRYFQMPTVAQARMASVLASAYCHNSDVYSGAET